MPPLVLSPTGGSVRLLLAAALVGVTACGTQPDAREADDDSSTSSQGGTERGPVVSRQDVDGDGRRDTTTYTVLAGDRVRITVRTGDGSPARRVLDTGLWPGRGGEWLGAAPIDGAPGAELVVGTTMGAHAPLYTVLTMADDELRVQANPAAPTPEWWTDAFANGFAGWTRTVRDGVVRMTFTMVFRDGDSRRFEGTRDTFRWDRGWQREGRTEVSVRGDRAAARLSGWHVPGLPEGSR